MAKVHGLRDAVLQLRLPDALRPPADGAAVVSNDIRAEDTMESFCHNVHRLMLNPRGESGSWKVEEQITALDVARVAFYPTPWVR
jgi:hypothetical protein